MSETVTSHDTYDDNRPGALVPVPPSMMVRTVLRPMTKALNPIIGRLAGKRHFSMPPRSATAADAPERPT